MGIPKNLTGERFGKIVAVSPTDKRSGRSIVWIFKCDCGITKEIPCRPVVAGLTKSCGCSNSIEARSNRENAKSLAQGRRYAEISGHYFSSMQRHAKEKNREFTITREDIWNKFLLQNRKCALSGVELKFHKTKHDQTSQTASLDRIDSTKGYIPGNIQWVHKDINSMKRNHSDKTFIEWCMRVVDTQKIIKDKV